MTDIETRAFDSQFELREAAGERTITGLAVPWNEVINVGGYKETFERGAFGEYRSVPVFYGHAHNTVPVGVLTRGEDTDAGYEVDVRLFDTPEANSVYAACKGGALRAFSVGFTPGADRKDKDVVVRTAANLREVSVVPFAAYSGAQFSVVRSGSESSNDTSTESQKMTDVTSADLDEVRNSLEDISRKVSTIETRGAAASAPAPFKFNSLGDFVKRGLLRKEATNEDIEIVTRAFAGGASAGDTVADASPGFAPSWAENDVHVIQQKRNVLELFDKKPLPENGMSFSYPSAVTVTGDVALQANEADNLTLIKLTLANATATVGTYGAYSDLSRQVIEREPVSYLNEVLDAQKQSYAKVTNSAVRTLLGTSPASYNQYTMGALATQSNAKAWVDAVLASTDAIATNSTLGLTGDVWLVSSAVFAKIASVYDSTNRPVFVVNGDGVNTVGGVNIIGQTANIAGLPVVVDRGLSGTDTFVLSRSAINVYEDGSKFLQDTNVINLTSQFSIYGYLALAKKDVKGITRVIVPAT